MSTKGSRSCSIRRSRNEDFQPV